MHLHDYELTVEWTGNRGSGTSGYRDFDRDHTVHAPGKPILLASSDPAFRGDPDRWNPEELLLAALSQCHMLWFLGLAAHAGVVVTGYVDDATGQMREQDDGAGQFVDAVLRPLVTVESPEMVAAVSGLHTAAHGKCFIARSVNFPVRLAPRTTVASRDPDE
ncbi:OsmC family peroxiredoxin [Rhodococcus sp. D2-41]|uniref:OsmC family protein n=1 Tax=Speluncibacter jeojiensis TaxID=2710754 RepID=UPI0024109A1B|nr:OsmC family protein [Rhodococcus sp. D2-41]MDG3011174.1 OsmC family peroxiredoxin [Rhodococcus sp. D2-41]